MNLDARQKALDAALASYSEAQAKVRHATRTLAVVGLFSCGQKSDSKAADSMLQFLAKRARERFVDTQGK